MFKKLILTFALLLLAVATSFADRRMYAWTYQPVTIAPEATELELYQTTKLNEVDSWEYRIEIEHGLSPRWDLSIYQIFAQAEGASFKWDAFQIRTRYRLTEPGLVLGNPVLYLEYNRKIDLKKQNKFEAKLLLGEDFNQYNLSVNPVYEFFWAPGDPVHEIGLDVGFSYSPSFKLALGLESTTRIEYKPNEDAKTGSYFGPTVSLATSTVFYTVGYAWGITDDSDDARVRFLMGIEL